MLKNTQTCLSEEEGKKVPNIYSQRKKPNQLTLGNHTCYPHPIWSANTRVGWMKHYGNSSDITSNNDCVMQILGTFISYEKVKR